MAGQSRNLVDDLVVEEGDEEVQYVMAEIVPGDGMLAPGSNMFLKGMDTASPVVVVDGKEFQGTYEDMLGTTLVYKPMRDAAGMWQRIGLAEKKLKLRLKPQQPS